MLFFILFLSFFLRVIRKGLRKNSEIFVNLGGPRVSLCVSGLTADHYFWCSRVFLAVLTVFRGIMGCSGVLWDVPGVVRGCSGLFRAVPGVFRGVPGCSGAVPGFTDTLLMLSTLITFPKGGNCLLKYLRKDCISPCYQKCQSLFFTECENSMRLFQMRCK